jgi:hypothetical protein
MNKVTVIHTAFEDSPRTVAFVEVGTRTGDEALEYAYHRTQNIEGSWSRNDFENNPDYSEDVTVMADLPVYDGVMYGLRSTSMGDQMILGNEKYKVAMCGFDRI